jgi:hypothetical protein
MVPMYSPQIISTYLSFVTVARNFPLSSCMIDIGLHSLYSCWMCGKELYTKHIFPLLEGVLVSSYFNEFFSLLSSHWFFCTLYIAICLNILSIIFTCQLFRNPFHNGLINWIFFTHTSTLPIVTNRTKLMHCFWNDSKTLLPQNVQSSLEISLCATLVTNRFKKQ